jgi:alpha-mannosidase
MDRRSKPAWSDYGPAEMVTNGMSRRLRASYLFLTFVAAIASSATLRAQQTELWHIGVFDRSSNEFRNEGIDYADPKSDPVFRIGQSIEARDWLRFQPGPANGMAGGRLHPFTILFDLQQAPSGSYHLQVAILYETPRLSHLRVEINGHSGLFYFQPKLDYGAGDWEGTFVPQTSTAAKIIEIPAAWFRRGENKIVLTALDEPSAVQYSLGSIALGHTGIVYDAIELSHSSGASSSAAISASLLPTIFYKTVAGKSVEVVDALLHFSHGPMKGTAKLAIGPENAVQSFDCEGEFGECAISFDIPEWNSAQNAALSVRTANATKEIRAPLAPAKKWTIFIVPHEHLDIGFTDYSDKIAELHSQSVDGVLDLLPTHPEFHWTVDGSWVAEKFLAGRSPQRSAQFLQSVRDRKITIPMQYANQHTGVASLEGLARSFYPSKALADKYSLPLGAAHITDVPSYSWSYASLLHAAGVKYFAAASNSWRAPVLLQGRWNEKSPFIWQGPDGGSVLMWYSRAYLQLSTLFGTPQRLEALRDALPVFLQAYSRPDYLADSAIIFGSQLENTTLSKEQADLARNWQSQFTYPRLQYSDFAAAMESIAGQFHGKLPTFRGDFGPYWEDGFASDSAHTAIHRGNQQSIVSAETFGTLCSVLDPALRPDESLLQSAWKNILLFDEHTWTFVGATTQPDAAQTTLQLDMKRSQTTEARKAITRSIHRSWAQFESLVSPKETSIIVFNSLNWNRSGFVEADLADGLAIVDATTKKEIPAETLSVGRGSSLPGFGGGYRRVRFLANDVPGLGYKLFTLQATKDTSASPSAANQVTPPSTFENSFYRITVDPAAGGISSIWDKQLDRELVDKASPYRFGAYLYVSGADDMPNNSLYRYGVSLKPPALLSTPAAHGKLVSSHRTPYGTEIVLESSAPHTPVVRTQITLVDTEKRIELSYAIHKESVLTKEAAYVAFPFDVANPQFAYETQSAWVNPAKDELPGGSREWYAVNHWAGVSNDNISAAVIPIDAPLINFGDIVRGNWPQEFTPKSPTIFSWLMNNYWGTNFAPQQGGDFTFRYDIVSSPTFDPVQLARAGRSAMTPLEADVTTATSSSSLLRPTQSTILEISNPNVALSTWKRAERGQDTVLRLVELSGKKQTTTISSPFFKCLAAWNANLLEEKQGEIPTSSGGLEITMEPYEIKTVLIRTASGLALRKDASNPPDTTGSSN